MPFRVSEGSLLSAFGVPTHRQAREEQEAQARREEAEIANAGKRQQAKMAAAQLFLQNTPIEDERRGPVEAFLAEALGGDQEAANIVTGMRPAAAEGFTLGKDQTRFSPTGEVIARGVESPAAGQPEATAAMRTRRQKIDDLMRLHNIGEADAVSVVDRNKRLTSPDSFGNIYLVDLVSGERKAVAGSGVGVPQQTTPPVTEEPPLGGMSPEEAAAKGTGPVAATLQGVSNLLGFMVSGQIAPKTTEARQTLRLFNKTIERGLVNNPRFPVKEQEIVRELMPSPDVFFKDPDTAVANVRQLHTHLQNQMLVKEREMQAPGITSARRAELSDQISGLRESLSLFPAAPDVGNFGNMSDEELGAVDSSQMSDEQKQQYINALKAAERR